MCPHNQVQLSDPFLSSYTALEATSSITSSQPHTTCTCAQNRKQHYMLTTSCNMHLCSKLQARSRKQHYVLTVSCNMHMRSKPQAQSLVQ
mmetsp:Transcript_19989/g.55644  ORF Transcript_19989/g.55644 Transcript_19989/m.55644 type:complete len:90 (-) Transcript_19989:1629-1898(-)|eukprot:1150875-Pelagomonas_calceolata.AAC.2